MFNMNSIRTGHITKVASRGDGDKVLSFYSTLNINVEIKCKFTRAVYNRQINKCFN